MSITNTVYRTLYRYTGLLIILLSFIFFITYPVVSAQDNVFLKTKSYVIVYVEPNDTVWSIAARYISDKHDIRDLISAITEINHLTTNSAIQPGQALKIPVKS
ncbi:hypothetical protein P22_0327 [Propionispora sp. 2/2-37]|uniref:LysM peptidoglycan-binding domain-containing protein n=1 Tax=Propionispora sp. 2/2-37 TaxID=1677858 RepID=UPI0006BB7C91|nr:LysM peptidoglycan-binding domain-containing protein [Propionispora sp. 2/2-37]CUH94261.1 hypothetical protein P22_0327 [Propionispora sp. 2/2-37]